MEPPETVARLRSTYASGRTRELGWRLEQLAGLFRLLDRHGPDLEAALRTDLGKPALESFVTEIGFLRTELQHTRRHLRRWLRPHRVPVPAELQPAWAKVVLEPLGVALVIAPWNYPVMLALSPVIGALAAGNAVLLKPSELTPTVAATLADLVPRYLDPDAVAVVQGDADATGALLEQRFDTIFFTGSTRVGQIVLEAAAKHLTPVTLELGGKSPVWVDASADLDVVASRLAWAKYLNAGQTCIAPDYLLSTEPVAAALVPRIRAAVEAMYGRTPQTSADYARIVTDRQHQRLRGLLDSGTVAFGGDGDPATRYLAPTVLTDVDPGSPVMTEEVFGPILPVVTVGSLDEAIGFVTARDKPLALYVFSDDHDVRRRWEAETSSGALSFGAAVVHLSVPGLPFGGVGASGMGSYHGVRSLRAFSHEKAVLGKPLHPDTLAILPAPYTRARSAILRRIYRGGRR